LLLLSLNIKLLLEYYGSFSAHLLGFWIYIFAGLLDFSTKDQSGIYITNSIDLARPDGEGVYFVVVFYFLSYFKDCTLISLLGFSFFTFIFSLVYFFDCYSCIKGAIRILERAKAHALANWNDIVGSLSFGLVKNGDSMDNKCFAMHFK